MRSAEVAIKLFVDFLFDHRLHHAEQKTELGVHVHFGLAYMNMSIDSAALKVQGIALPPAGNVEPLGDRLGSLVDRRFCVFQRASVRAADIDLGHVVCFLAAMLLI